jgi:hypothetical protein
VGALAVEPAAVVEVLARGEPAAVALADVAVEGVTETDVAPVELLVGGAVSLAVEVVVDVPDGTLAGSGLCACLAAPAAPRAVCEEPASSELARSCPCAARLPLR